jgi:hypothetical protein
MGELPLTRCLGWVIMASDGWLWQVLIQLPAECQPGCSCGRLSCELRAGRLGRFWAGPDSRWRKQKEADDDRPCEEAGELGSEV